MEKGEPLKGEVALARDGGRIYDLLAQKEVPVRSVDGGLQFPGDLGPGDGRLFLVLDEAMGTPTVEIPSEARRGGRRKPGRLLPAKREKARRSLGKRDAARRLPMPSCAAGRRVGMACSSCPLRIYL